MKYSDLAGFGSIVEVVRVTNDVVVVQGLTASTSLAQIALHYTHLAWYLTFEERFEGHLDAVKELIDNGLK